MFEIYKNKKVFVTGHTGFKGSWLTLWLNLLGAEVLGYSLPPNTDPALYNVLNLQERCQSVFGDIRDREYLNRIITGFNPDIVFHLAAQPLVRQSYFNPIETYETNVIGTLNLLEAAKKCSNMKAFVNITTDKCYENKEINCGYKETDSLGGDDMYSSSKGCVEVMSASYRKSFLQEGKPYAMATARAGNVIGGGDWTQDRIIPDCIKAINQNKSIAIRNPQSIRPWQHVLEPLFGYLTLGQKLIESGTKYAQSFNFGPKEESALTVYDLVQKIFEFYQKGEIIIDKRDNLHESNILMLNIEKSKNILGWEPLYMIQEAVKETAEWYKRYYNKEEMLDFTVNQILNYQNKLNEYLFQTAGIM